MLDDGPTQESDLVCACLRACGSVARCINMLQERADDVPLLMRFEWFRTTCGVRLWVRSQFYMIETEAYENPMFLSFQFNVVILEFKVFEI